MVYIMEKGGFEMKHDCLCLEQFAQTIYKKCECCGRVRDNFFRLNVKDARTKSMIVGSFDLCKECGQNFGDILKVPISTERTVDDFSFE